MLSLILSLLLYFMYQLLYLNINSKFWHCQQLDICCSGAVDRGVAGDGVVVVAWSPISLGGVYSNVTRK